MKQVPFDEFRKMSPVLKLNVSCTELFDMYNAAFKKATKFVLEKSQAPKDTVYVMEWTRREFVDALVEMHKEQNNLAKQTQSD
jgi:hypothetical protein